MTGPQSHGILGQEDALRALAQSAVAGRVAGAYLLHGPEGTGRRLGAELFGAALLCRDREGLSRCGMCASCRRHDEGTDPDFLVVTADRGPRFDDDADADRAPISEFTRAARRSAKAEPRRTIGVRVLRRVLAVLSLATTAGAHRVVLIDSFDEVEEEGAAALLKTLEEAPARTTFLLLARGTDGVPDTILSRCQRVRFRPLPPDVVQSLLLAHGGAAAQALDQPGRQLVARLAQGSAGRAIRILASGLAALPFAESDTLSDGRDDAIDLALRWVRDAGRDLDAQRERSRELCALVLLRVRDRWTSGRPAAIGDPAASSRVQAVRGALESLDANVSPEVVLRALGVRLGRAAALPSWQP